MREKDGKARDDKPRSRARGRPRRDDQQVGSEALLEAAARLMAQSRAPQISRSEVAKAAGVDEKLVRYYYQTYEDLIDAVLEVWMRDLDGTMQRATRLIGTTEDVIYNRFSALLDFVAVNPSGLRTLISRVYDEDTATARERLKRLNIPAFRRHKRVVERGIKRGEIRGGFDARLLYIATVGLAEIFVLARPILDLLYEGEDAVDLQAKYRDFVVDLILRGIGTNSPNMHDNED